MSQVLRAWLTKKYAIYQSKPIPTTVVPAPAVGGGDGGGPLCRLRFARFRTTGGGWTSRGGGGERSFLYLVDRPFVCRYGHLGALRNFLVPRSNLFINCSPVTTVESIGKYVPRIFINSILKRNSTSFQLLLFCCWYTATLNVEQRVLVAAFPHKSVRRFPYTYTTPVAEVIMFAGASCIP